MKKAVLGNQYRLHSGEKGRQMCKKKNRTLDFPAISCYIPLEKNRKAVIDLIEDEKIQRVIEENEGFFQNTISDIARTKKGARISFEFDKEHN